MRFDFSWPCALTPAQVAAAEDIVVKRIQSALPVHSQLVALGDATKITALRQVFGESYPDPVSPAFFLLLLYFLQYTRTF